MSMKRSVFKKASPNNKIVVYLGRRDIFDDLTTVDPIDGVITMDQAYVKGRKIYARIQCAFRYGQENLDNIMTGVTFMKEFFINTDQIYPIDKRKPQHKLTIVQVCLGLYHFFATV
ncbi:unnamed protein product [Protopolystoma xenopodis]|uniref:Arrestin-like N-terminal domain-containing protein n=1 Tax=Protopolystoma xenopodis TaxID=117903 RepID=A0A448XAE8_9PLAT|nr:unnamed protein product [Protopolystoma xenopodis]